jgi:glucokinase
MTKQLVAGIDIGGTNSVFGLVNQEGHILIRDQISTTTHLEPEALVAALADKIQSGIAHLGADYTLVGVGVGAPNGNFFSGCIEFAPNLNWKGIVPLAAYFKQAMGCNCLLTNDANAAALGEMFFGGAKGMRDFLFVTLGTGLGSGIVVNGDLVYGHDGMAGEIGHVILIPEGRLCACGRKGCVETYCSATGLRRTYLEKSGRSDTAGIDAKYIAEMARSGDQFACDAFAYTGELLGLALANSVAYTSPQAIFLFGGLAQAGELILDPTKQSFEKNLLRIYQNKINLLPSKLKESDAAILGSASLIWNTLILS